MTLTSLPRPLPGEPVVPEAAELSQARLGSLRAVAARRGGVPMAELRLVFALRDSDLSRPAGPMLLSESAMAGTKELDRSALAAEIDSLGGHLAFVLRDGWLSVRASALEENLAPLGALVSSVLTSARYPLRAVGGDRARLAEEIVIAKSQPATIAKEAISRRLHGRHPLASGLPRPSALARVGRAGLLRLHSELLTPENASAVVVSRLDPEAALAALGEGLGSWCETPGGRAEPGAALPAVKAGPLLWHERIPAVQTNLRFGRLAPRRSDESWAAASIANLAFGGLFASRLVDNLRERRGYTYSPRSEIQHFPSGSRLVIAADVANDVTAQSVVEIRYELGRAATEGFSDEEVDFAKRYALGTFAFSTATQSGLAAMIEALLAQGVDTDYLQAHPRRIAALDTTEVNAAAETLLAPTSFAAVAIGDSSAALAALERVEGVALA